MNFGIHVVDSLIWKFATITTNTVCIAVHASCFYILFVAEIKFTCANVSVSFSQIVDRSV